MPGLLPVRFPGPLAEPGVPVSGHRALHGSCRQVVAGVQGLNRSMQHIHGWRVEMLARLGEQTAGASRT